MAATAPSTPDKLAESADGTVGLGSTVEQDSTVVIATRKRGTFWADFGLRSLSIVGFFLAWYAFVLLNAHVWRMFNPVLLPAPHEVLKAAIELTASGELPRD